MKKVILLKNLAKSAAGRKEEARTRYIYIYIYMSILSGSTSQK